MKKNNSNFLISVIVPVYNVEKYLSNCLDSIINQTYRNLEIILVDDGSTDGSVKICDDYAKKDNRIIVIHKENGGASTARNKGLDIAKGDYISFIDSDDYINCYMLEHLLNAIIRDNTDISICKIKFTKSLVESCNDNKDGISSVIMVDDVYEKLYNGQGLEMTSPCNKLIAKSVFKDLRYPVGIINEDIAILHLLMDRIREVSYINEIYYYYYQHDASVTHKKNPSATQCVQSFINRGEYFLSKNKYKYYELNSYNICLTLAEFYKDIKKDFYKSNIKKYGKVVLKSNYCKLFYKIVIVLIRIHPITLKFMLKMKKILKG